jgi:C-terminal processing protease CtpA/Prc
MMGMWSKNVRSISDTESKPGKFRLTENPWLVLVVCTAQERTLDGTLLEGQGLVPDIEVALDRTLLLKDVDSQLEAAIQTIEQEIKR